jgi:hypothetical protein
LHEIFLLPVARVLVPESDLLQHLCLDVRHRGSWIVHDKPRPAAIRVAVNLCQFRDLDAHGADPLGLLVLPLGIDDVRPECSEHLREKLRGDRLFGD